MKTPPSSVVSASSSLLKIVPSSLLQANVKISNRDIGFIKVGQDVSVSVDSFPSGEFGYIQGKLLSLGSDSLPPDQNSPIVHFPATISLSQQSVLSGNEQLNLQSGMGITANIKLRSRPAISIVTDIFTRQMEGLSAFVNTFLIQSYKYLLSCSLYFPSCIPLLLYSCYISDLSYLLPKLLLSLP